jgi:hypothetical protein
LPKQPEYALSISIAMPKPRVDLGGLRCRGACAAGIKPPAAQAGSYIHRMYALFLVLFPSREKERSQRKNVIFSISSFGHYLLVFKSGIKSKTKK